MMNLVTMATNAHKEVVGFDVSMDEVLFVDVFNATNHLIGQHQHGFHGKATATKVEQVLQRRSQQVHDEHIVLLLLSVPSGGRKRGLVGIGESLMERGECSGEQVDDKHIALLHVSVTSGGKGEFGEERWRKGMCLLGKDEEFGGERVKQRG